MKAGKAFEIFVKRILINVGFFGVESDGVYVFGLGKEQNERPQ